MTEYINRKSGNAKAEQADATKAPRRSVIEGFIIFGATVAVIGVLTLIVGAIIMIDDKSNNASPATYLIGIGTTIVGLLILGFYGDSYDNWYARVPAGTVLLKDFESGQFVLKIEGKNRAGGLAVQKHYVDAKIW